MNKAGIIIGAAIVLVLIIGFAFWYAGNGTSPHNAAAGLQQAQQAAATGSGQAGNTPTTGNTQASGGAQTSGSAPRVRLQDTPYMNYAYLISDNATSPQEDAALAGFQVQKQTLADGSLQVTLKALQPEYHDQTYMVQPGEKLYFIETSFGDDRSSQEYNLGDDTAVLVDADGYIIPNSSQ